MSFHEAGHAIVARYLAVPVLGIIEDTTFTGSTDIEREAVILLAGCEVDKKRGRAINEDCVDYRRAKDLITQLSDSIEEQERFFLRFKAEARSIIEINVEWDKILVLSEWLANKFFEYPEYLAGLAPDVPAINDELITVVLE